MAHIVTDGNVCEISSIAAGDVIYWTEMFPDPHYANGIDVNVISFDPAAAADTAVVRQRTADGPRICKNEVTDTYDARNWYGHGSKLKPVVVGADQTWTAGAVLTIVLGNTI